MEVNDMDFESLALEFDGDICRLTLTQGERGNPLDGRLCAEIREVGNILTSRANVRVLLVSAQGPAFSFGGDVTAFARDIDELPLTIERWTADLHVGIARLQRIDAPIVAAVHGVCAGGMTAFVAGADFVLAANDARFVSAYAGIGFSSDAGSSIMLSRRMGLSRARRFLILNEVLTAAEALACGLVDEALPPDKLNAHAEDLARRLARGPTRAYGEIRRLLLSAHEQPLEVQLELEAQALARVARTADAREGIRSFVEKRKPSFVGA
jgi:2-(1,2-epoxy-1,2-dihydrophenyl)acetyl-CoA isomerase